MGQHRHGVIYVAYGGNARREASESIASLREWHDWPVAIVGDRPMKGGDFIRWRNRGTPGRWAKVNLNNLSIFDQVLFLDADTRIRGPLDVGFRILDAGWDLVIVPSEPQDDRSLSHLSDDERRTTFNEIGRYPLQLNTGVMWFAKSDRLDALFVEWRREWERWRDKDQGALLRALERCPLRIWLLGRAFNGGSVVEHRFGMARG